MKKLLLLSTLVVATAGSAQWNAVQIGTSSTAPLDDIIMLQGRNDGLERIYAGSWGGTVEEWSWNGTSWSETDILTGVYVGLLQVGGGDGRNDGVNRIYVGEHGASARLWEVTWNGTAWVPVLIATPGAITSVMVGDGRGDGISRVYAGGGSGWGIKEYEWDGAAWITTTVSANYSESNGAVGDADNDGNTELYINSNCEKFYEYAGSWVEAYVMGSCGTPVWTDANHIAEGRNDGNNRLYVTGEGLGKYEYTWTGSSWTATPIATVMMQRGDIHVAALHADDQQRVYGSNSYESWGGTTPAGPLEEFEWDGSAWVNLGTVMDATTGATGWMVAGTGRNDDTMRLYVPNMLTDGIWEVTAPDPNYVGAGPGAIKEKVVPVELNLFPNPANDVVVVEYEFANNTTADLQITNVLGQVVTSLSALPAKTKQVIGLSDLEAGVYFVQITAGGDRTVSERLVIRK